MRASRSRMVPNLNNFLLQKIIKKFNFEDKNIEKYAIFGKTIFLFQKKHYIYTYAPQIAALA
jgi:hypothetical protein